MSEVFDGKSFLEEKSCDITFSNGLKVSVVDVTDEGMDKLSGLEKVKAPKVAEIRAVLAAMIGEEEVALAKVGMRELNAVISFLSKALFE